MKILLVVYDNLSDTHHFPMGLGYIASVLREAGHEVVIYSQDFHHYPDEHLTEYLDENKFDVIGYSTIAGYYQYRKTLAAAEAINKSKNRPYFILGGHGPAPEPEFYLKKTQADCAVIGEGEETMLEIIDALENKKPFSDILGIAYREGDDVHITPRRPVIEDIDAIPFPAWDLFPIEYYRQKRMPNSLSTDFVMPVLSGRGCKFKCNFCYRLDPGQRIRSDESILEEIERLKKDFGITYIVFIDELLMSSEERTISLCNAMIKNKTNVKWWCNGRLNYAKPDVLAHMKKAGCVFINYGIESMDNDALRNMNKALTVDQVYKGVDATLAAGLSPGLNIIFGNIGETMETLKSGTEFLLKYLDGSQMRTIRPVTPYPGSPLYYHAIKEGLIKDVEDFYENKHLNSDLLAVNFTTESEEDIYRGLLEANEQLIKSYYDKQVENALSSMRSLYLDKNVAFRGFRHR
ncbi:radical SAM protein [Pseudodesulfovibrio sp. zrk46]|uniref:B12-binding domain-containing radical SAM protein n=1 Tax=Pseudodesulfovibrio sp. zrk46 TaxID=2725288 RepID=UPI001449AE15|nr:radical SAM protein [Pseudodesulfovibrio sp. zrk46]QJB56568.1 B12-binding domain-containing radical SAM protein [Pseudodesulfovibrio sp. zrk46]